MSIAILATSILTTLLIINGWWIPPSVQIVDKHPFFNGTNRIKCIETAIWNEKIDPDRSSHLTSIARWPIFSDSWQQKSASPAWTPFPIPDRWFIACHASPSGHKCN